MNAVIKIERIDTPEFWLLIRKFAMAPEGVVRDHAKKVVLDYICRVIAA